MPLDQRLDLTSSMGDRRRIASVNQLVYFLLIMIAIADAIGAVLSVFR